MITRKEKLRLSEIILTQFEGVDILYDNEYDEDDKKIIRFVFNVDVQLLLDALATTTLTYVQVKAILKDYLQYIALNTVEHLLVSLDDLLSEVFNKLPQIQQGTFRFKGDTPFRRKYFVVSTIRGIQHCLGNDDLDGFCKFLSFMRFPSRMPVKRQDLEVSAWEKFLAVEQKMKKTNQMLRYTKLKSVEAGNRILLDWFRDWKFDGTLCSHGSGSVAQGPLSILEKEACLDRIPAMAALDYEVNLDLQPAPARIAFVPKSYKAVRTIAMEDVTLMFLQRGVSEPFKRICNRKHGSHINFEDNEIYRRKTKRGSISGYFDTIDMSAASDSVASVLVDQLFAGLPIYEYLTSFRNENYFYEDVDGIPIEGKFEKYAAMGSRLCFPVLTCVCACAAQLACNVARGDSWDNSRWHPITIFGDDVIIPHYATMNFIKIMEGWGFTINIDKSFTSNEKFRESCGFFFYEAAELHMPVVSRFLNPSYNEGSHAPRSWSWEARFIGIDKLVPMHNQLYYIHAECACRLIKRKLPTGVCYTSRYDHANKLVTNSIPNWSAEKVIDKTATDLQKCGVRSCCKTATWTMEGTKSKFPIPILSESFDSGIVVSDYDLHLVRKLDGLELTPASYLYTEWLRTHVNSETEISSEDSTSFDVRLLQTFAQQEGIWSYKVEYGYPTSDGGLNF